MAGYIPANLTLLSQALPGAPKVWVYKSVDAFADVDATDYFSDAVKKGMAVLDLVYVYDTDASPVAITLGYVSAIDADGNGTILPVVV